MKSSMDSSKAINVFELSATACGLKLIATLQTSVNEDYKGANEKALRTEWFILTSDFWFVELLFPRVRKSFRDCD